MTTLNGIGKDRQVRRIRLWQSVWEGAGGTTYPSPALAVAAAVGSQHTADLDSFLVTRVAVECGHAGITFPSWPPVRQEAVQFPYVFGDRSDAPALFRIDMGGRSPIAFRRIAAGQLFTFTNKVAAPAGDIDADPFRDRVIVVGASCADSGDVYETPLGSMPGTLVIANSIVQAKAVADTAPASPLVKNILAMLLFLLLAFVARTFIGAAAFIILGLVTLLALFAISRTLGFAAGIDVIAVAVPGFAFFKLIDSMVFIGMNVPKLGWRAILKP